MSGRREGVGCRHFAKGWKRIFSRAESSEEGFFVDLFGEANVWEGQRQSVCDLELEGCVVVSTEQ